MTYTNPSMPCRHIELERSEVGEVSMCVDCQVVHVSLQHMTLRFRLEAFQVLVRTLATANGKIDSLTRAMHGSQGELAVEMADAHMASKAADKFH